MMGTRAGQAKASITKAVAIHSIDLTKRLGNGRAQAALSSHAIFGVRYTSQYP